MIQKKEEFVCVELELNFMSHSVCGVEIHIFRINHQLTTAAKT